MNVLIYSGSDPYSIASKRLKSSLGRLLSKSHDVKLASAQLLSKEPWKNHTSLIVFPDENEPEIRNLIDSETRRSIKKYVECGGRFLGIGNGAQFSDYDQLGLVPLLWNLNAPSTSSAPEINTQRKVTISESFPKDLIKNFHVPRQTAIESGKNTFSTQVSQVSSEAGNYNTLAHYSDREDLISGIHCKILDGAAVLMGFDVSESPEWLMAALSMLGVESIEESAAPETPSALYMVSELPSVATQVLKERILSYCSTEDDHKKRIAFINGNDGSFAQGTSFDWKRYFSSLKPESCYCDPTSSLGLTVLYAETVESTQTLLEKNSKLSDALPNGTVTIAKNQTCGRGRGSNSWISTEGSVQFSILIKVDGVNFGLVFVQYLFGLAVVEWLRQEKGLNVRLKWPNDIYGCLEESGERDKFKKLGGILVNCSYGGLKGTECKIIIGCGLNNLLEPQPATTTSIKSLIEKKGRDSSDKSHLIKNEEIIGGILRRFQEIWTKFKLNSSFSEFEKRYYDSWLHSDQVITYNKSEDQLKIIGLSPTHGLLRTVKVQTSSNSQIIKTQPEEIVDLLPDSNSFDMFSGLVRSKG